MWFSCDPNSLWSPRPSHAQPILSFPHRSLPQNFSDEFGRVSRQNSDHGVVTVLVKDRIVEKTRTRTLSGVKGGASGAVLNEEEIAIPDGSFFNLGPLGGEPASPSESDRGPYLHLSSLIISLPHHHNHHPSFSKRSARSRAVLEVVDAVPRASPVPHRPCTFVSNSKLWIALLTMGITSHYLREQEYVYLSYLHFVDLGLDEVYRLVHTVTEGLGTRGLIVSFLFPPVFPPMSTRPKLVSSSKHASVLVSRSLCWTLGAHGTKSPTLLRPQNLLCACDEVSPESCLSLGAMSFEVSVVVCTSSGVMPNSVSHFLREVFIYEMLIPVYSPRLSSNPFWSPRRTSTAITPFNHNSFTWKNKAVEASHHS
jgi:hypothetical protein